MILYQYPGGDGIGSLSPPCLKVELALRRVGAKFRVVQCTSPGQAAKVSPSGRLPALDIDGAVIADSVTILDTLEQRFPDKGLSPAEPAARTRDRLWEHFVNDGMYWLGFYLRWLPPDNRERTFRALFSTRPALVRLAVRGLLLPGMVRRARAVGIGDKTEQQVIASVDRALEMLESGLEGGPFLQARPQPGRGDLAVASLLVQGGFRDTLPDFQARFRARPALVEHTASVFEACSTAVPPSVR